MSGEQEVIDRFLTQVYETVEREQKEREENIVTLRNSIADRNKEIRR